ncbi:histidine--tRNA ligase [Posidoniimonas polymericola]|uniref:histidine--tRNA ligase n=1 Tax=Posidoniimonas polymericola TaxID=2528002 RepID=UPI0011B394F4|nr:histidine--tRNA ligase [Posidoniimonas polymericola]
MIQPRTLKGFRDYLPEAMIPRERLIDTARRVYRSFGFAPIDTPALEYLEVLTGKGSDETDKQLYRFQDHGGRDVGLRFDLTVPLARFAAQHIGQLGTPFKRYHIATVWRGENTQRGRYREFMQCDFDTIGTTAVAADIEAILVINDLLAAIGFDKFTIHVNNRGILNAVLRQLGLADQSTAVLRALDKLSKAGWEKVEAELCESAGASHEQATAILDFSQLRGGCDEVLSAVEPMISSDADGEAALKRTREMMHAVSSAGVPDHRVKIDVSIARGLDYYTGLVFETTLDDLPGIGSIASGGRYDNLADLYTKQQLPGIGGSLGLDRLLSAMEELELIETSQTTAEVFIPLFEASRLGDYLKLAARVRAAGIGCEVYPEPKKLGKQLQYADKKGFKAALIAGGDEFANHQVQVKNLGTGESTTVALTAEAVVKELMRVLS